MEINWYIISGGFVVSLLLTFILWKAGLLRIFLAPFGDLGPRDISTWSCIGMQRDIRDIEVKATFRINRIFEAQIPKWMAKPPLSWAICFLIVCIGIAVIILAVSAVL